jgi:hypothetical protein
MKSFTRGRNPLQIDRRRFFALSTGFAGAAIASVIRPQTSPPENCSPPIPSGPFNGSDCPFPIPWLDKNGSHNQSPMPGAELSNIFHFKGQIARSNGFVGMGRDNHGNRLAFGSPTTDFSYMKGTYFAGRREHSGVFAHI